MYLTHNTWLVLRSTPSVPAAASLALQVEGLIADHDDKVSVLSSTLYHQLQDYLRSPGRNAVAVTAHWSLVRLGRLLPKGARPVGVIHLDPLVTEEMTCDPGSAAGRALLMAARTSREPLVRDVYVTTEHLPTGPLELDIPVSVEQFDQGIGVAELTHVGRVPQVADKLTVVDPAGRRRVVKDRSGASTRDPRATGLPTIEVHVTAAQFDAASAKPHHTAFTDLPQLWGMTKTAGKVTLVDNAGRRLVVLDRSPRVEHGTEYSCADLGHLSAPCSDPHAHQG